MNRLQGQQIIWAVLLFTTLAFVSVHAETPREVFFGDLHLHTGYSFDAIASGTRTTPDDAYRYARGEPVAYLGRMVRIKRPLDFLAVTDHAEYLGVPFAATAGEDLFTGTRWPGVLAGVDGDTLAYMRIFSASAFTGTAPPVDELRTEAITTSLWQRVIDAAEQHYVPEKFTTLVGFEWSPMPGGAHLHRNVIFRGPDYPSRPFSSLDSRRPEDLWTYVEALRGNGIDSILIPHNANLSRGRMFAVTDSSGAPISPAYAGRRVRNERLVEITQIKGTSETRPGISPADEFAGFELLTLNTEAGSDPAGAYLRPALARGLEIGNAIGVNPFEFGLVGSSDFHSGTSSIEEDNFNGALGRADDMRDPESVLTEVNPISGTPATVFSSSGLTGVWAGSNTREAIFDALKRREAFATSGTRVRVRMFAGWDYEERLFQQKDWIERAYRGGVPMGSELAAPATGAAALRLAVHAVKDPGGANLDRIQVIKLWYDGAGVHEAVYDVAWSGDRAPDEATGRLPPVGNSVDLATATYTNRIGAAQLETVWVDPSFDPGMAAIYYVRVIEIPTPRWTTYLAVRNGLPLPESVPPVIQERAWTSPVFYRPGVKNNKVQPDDDPA